MTLNLFNLTSSTSPNLNIFLQKSASCFRSWQWLTCVSPNKKRKNHLRTYLRCCWTSESLAILLRTTTFLQCLPEAGSEDLKQKLWVNSLTWVPYYLAVRGQTWKGCPNAGVKVDSGGAPRLATSHLAVNCVTWLQVTSRLDINNANYR